MKKTLLVLVLIPLRAIPRGPPDEGFRPPFNGKDQRPQICPV